MYKNKFSIYFVSVCFLCLGIILFLGFNSRNNCFAKKDYYRQHINQLLQDTFFIDRVLEDPTNYGDPRQLTEGIASVYLNRPNSLLARQELRRYQRQIRSELVNLYKESDLNCFTFNFRKK